MLLAGDTHRTDGGGIDHAYTLTSYAVQGSTRDVPTRGVDASTTRTYVDINRGGSPITFTSPPRTIPSTAKHSPVCLAPPADEAVAERLRASPTS